MGGNGRRRRRRRRRSTAGLTVKIAAVALLLVAVFVGMQKWETSRHPKQPRGVASADFYKQTKITVDGTTYDLKQDFKSVLVMGVDHSDEAHENAEMLMLLALDHEDKQIHWLHINRDARVVDDEGVETTLDAPWNLETDAKTRNLARTGLVESLLGGVDVDYYITFDLDRLSQLNEMIGGIPVTIEDDFSSYDPAMTPGATLTLTNSQLELFLSDEVSVGDENARMRRQQAFVLGMFERLKGIVKSETNSATELLDQMGDMITTNFYQAQMLNEFARAYAYVVPEAQMLPGAYETAQDGSETFIADAAAARQWALEAFYTKE